MSNSENRIFGLDFLRALAITLVVVYHGSHILNPLSAMPNIIGKIIGKLVALSNPFGMLGVEIFFVLSGFLIGGILLNIVLNEEHFTTKDLRVFWMKRWFRTLPLYYIILLISSILYNYLYDLPFDWRYLFFLQNFNSPHPSFLGEAWSLCIEEWFYISFPLLLFTVLLLFKKLFSTANLFLYTIIIYCIAFQLFRLFNAIDPTYISLDSGLRKIVYLRLDAIGYGVLMAYFMRFNREFLFKNKNILLLLSVTGVVLIVGTQYIGDMIYGSISEKFSLYLFLNRLLLFTLLPVLFSLLLPFFYFIKTNKKNIFTSLVTQISLTSYSIYLIHYTLLYIPLFKILPNQTPLSSIIIYISYLLCIYITAFISYRFIELSGLRLRDKWIEK